MDVNLLLTHFLVLSCYLFNNVNAANVSNSSAGTDQYQVGIFIGSVN